MTVRKYSSRSQQTTLSSGLTSNATTMSVVSGSALMGGKTLAGTQTYTVVIDPDTALEEIVDVTVYSSGNTLTITRNIDGSTGQAHSAGAVVRHMAIGRDYQEANDHIEAASGVHGLAVGVAVVGDTATQTLTNKTLTAPKINENVAVTATATELNILDGVTSSTAELNILDGVTASTTELNYVDGVTSAIQTQLDAKQAAVSGVSSTEIGYLDGVTSAIQTQIDGKQAVVSGVSSTEIGYLDGVTSAIQTQIDAKAPSANPTFTGTVTLPTGAITTGAIADGTIVNADINTSAQIAYGKLNLTNTIVNGDINASAAIDKTKISGTAITAGDTGTVTSTMIADGTIVNGDINASAAIALSKLATDPLARANHTGTQAASTISDFNTQVRTSKVTDLAAPTGSFSMNSQKITSLGTPTSDTDAATKAYADLMIPLTQKGAANGVAELDADGLVPVHHLPPLSITTTQVVSSQAAMLALTAQTGDVAVRTDTNKTFILTTTPASTLGNWQELLTPTDSVISVDGQTGAVNLSSTYATIANAANKLPLAGGTMSGAIAMGSNKITGLGTPTSTGDAATKDYADTKLPLTGGTLSGQINMGANKITNLADPTNLTDAMTLNYFNTAALAPSNLTGPITSIGPATTIASQTGTGTKFVMEQSPTLVTPNIGAATATSINGTTIPSSKTLVATDSTTYVVPSQSGNSGKALTTDGTTSSWSTTINGTAIPANKTLVATDSTAQVVPSQTGNSGKYLTTDGTTSSWGTVAGYSAPTLGSTSIASGATVSTIANLTLSDVSLSETTAIPMWVTVASYRDMTASLRSGENKWNISSLPTGYNWQDVTYGNGKFVAVAYYGPSYSTTNKYAYSTDGTTWTLGTFPTTANWWMVTYGNGVFVAVTYTSDYGVQSNKAVYSSDGINWTATTLPSVATWEALGYGNGKFVALGVDADTGVAKAAYSSNGVTWTAGTISGIRGMGDIVYGAGKFIAKTSASSVGAVSSSDGITWTAVTLPSGGYWFSGNVSYGNSKFIATGGENIAYSTNGTTWTLVALPGGYSSDNIAFGDGKFILAGYGTDISLTSTDGISWTSIPIPYGNWQSLTYGDPTIATSGTLTVDGSTGTPGQVLQSTGGGRAKWGYGSDTEAALNHGLINVVDTADITRCNSYMFCPNNGRVSYTLFGVSSPTTVGRVQMNILDIVTSATYAGVGLYQIDLNTKKATLLAKQEDASLFQNYGPGEVKFTATGGYPPTYTLVPGVTYAIGLLNVSNGYPMFTSTAYDGATNNFYTNFSFWGDSWYNQKSTVTTHTTLPASDTIQGNIGEGGKIFFRLKG